MSTPARRFQVEGLTETFLRKPFEIEAVQVTEENIKEVAKWCGGKVKTKPAEGNSPAEQFISVPVHNPTNEEQKTATIGKWVLWSRTTAFKVYTKRAFESSFIPKEEIDTKTQIEKPFFQQKNEVDEVLAEANKPAEHNQSTTVELTPEEEEEAVFS